MNKTIQRVRKALHSLETLSESPRIWAWAPVEGPEMCEPTRYYICENLSSKNLLVLQNMTADELLYLTDQNTHLSETGEVVVEVSEDDIRIIGGE